MNYQNVLNNYGYILYEPPHNQIQIFAFIIQLLVSKSIIDFSKLTIFNILGFIMIGAAKKYFKTKRPINCSNTQFDYCPTSYDIPSGHSFYSVFWLLVIYLSLKQNSKNKINKNNNKILNSIKKIVMLYLVFIPLTRYLSHVHSLSAVILGCLLGFIWFIFYSVF